MSNLEPPHNAQWKQQKMRPCCRPVLTSQFLLKILVGIAVLFCILGLLLVLGSDNVKEVSVRYDIQTGCQLDSEEPNYGQPCTVDVEIEEDMDFPVYFYYQINNFYQNHRTYLESYSQYQLSDKKPDNVDNCDPIDRTLTENLKKIYPCGLIARSFFSDRFSASVMTGSDVVGNLCTTCDEIAANDTVATNWGNFVEDDSWENKDIAWTVDTDDRFKYTPNWESDYADAVTNVGDYQEKQGLLLPRVDDPDFIVWFRTAALPNFRKLHRIIHKYVDGNGNEVKKFEKGQVVSFTVHNYFDVQQYSGEKHIVLTTLTWFGSSAYFLGVSYIVVGCFSFIGAAILLVWQPPRKLGNYDEFAWLTDS